jgi:hypothetical protein
MIFLACQAPNARRKQLPNDTDDSKKSPFPPNFPMAALQHPDDFQQFNLHYCQTIEKISQ